VEGDPSQSETSEALRARRANDSGPPLCYARSRAGPPRREASGSGGPGRLECPSHVSIIESLLSLLRVGSAPPPTEAAPRYNDSVANVLSNQHDISTQRAVGEQRRATCLATHQGGSDRACGSFSELISPSRDRIYFEMRDRQSIQSLKTGKRISDSLAGFE
jgi:hypothetical protein